jgi:polyhydroxyalkanoate synthesis repressor PhaR
MSTVRVIKKYPNRRLYDTDESRYITLADVRGLVCDHVEFAVIDKKTGEDITRCVLLQVISEQEQRCGAVMSQEFLSQVIRSYGHAMSECIAAYLEQCLRLLIHQPPRVLGGIDSPASDIAQVSFTRWKAHQDESRAADSPAGRAIDREARAESRKKAG